MRRERDSRSSLGGYFAGNTGVKLSNVTHGIFQDRLELHAKNKRLSSIYICMVVPSL